MHVLVPFCVSGSCPPESGMWAMATEQAYALDTPMLLCDAKVENTRLIMLSS